MDTIAAISTALGEGGIAIVRISGDEAIAIGDKIFQGKNKLSEVKSHTIHYGTVKEIKSGEILDEALVSVMRKPNTYTREDVVEINVHGGVVSAVKVLDTVLEAGARLAEPGEFTKRAFLSGRIDLTQAEAVIDLIRAKTDQAQHAAMAQLGGSLSREVHRSRKIILELMAHIEVNIDYPEHDVEEVTYGLIEEKIEEVRSILIEIEKRGREGRILREGIATAIIGKPNVGKSSLLNALSGQAKAIVTDIPGTTRDVVEEYVNLRGVPLKLMDTAGIRETKDMVERIGVERSKEVLKRAELILLMLNQAEPLDELDEALLAAVESKKNLIVLLNKSDLPERIGVDQMKRRLNGVPIEKISLKTGAGLKKLEERISHMFLHGEISGNDELFMLNSRHLQLVRQAIRSFEDSLQACEDRLPYDMIEIDLQKGFSYLGEIIGETASEDLITQIFSQFCLGK